MGVFGGENWFFADFCIFLHFLTLFWQKLHKTLQKLGAFGGFLGTNFNFFEFLVDIL